jgi:hypothetical protein
VSDPALLQLDQGVVSGKSRGGLSTDGSMTDVGIDASYAGSVSIG